MAFIINGLGSYVSTQVKLKSVAVKKQMVKQRDNMKIKKIHTKYSTAYLFSRAMCIDNKHKNMGERVLHLLQDSGFLWGGRKWMGNSGGEGSELITLFPQVENPK